MQRRLIGLPTGDDLYPVLLSYWAPPIVLYAHSLDASDLWNVVFHVLVFLHSHLRKVFLGGKIVLEGTVVDYLL
jgi:hypothetical protein